MSQTMILLVGDLARGFKAVGPFPDLDALAAYEHRKKAQGHRCALNPPDGWKSTSPATAPCVAYKGPLSLTAFYGPFGSDREAESWLFMERPAGKVKGGAIPLDPPEPPPFSLSLGAGASVREIYEVDGVYRLKGVASLLGASFHVEFLRMVEEPAGDSEATMQELHPDAGTDTRNLYSAFLVVNNHRWETVQLPGYQGDYAMFVYPFGA